MCEKEKDISEFSVTGNRLYSYCKKCCVEYRKNYRKKAPYKLTYRSIMNRCYNKKHDAYQRYGGKGIKNFLTIDQLRHLWYRDEAYKLKKPSIDRIDNSSHYTFDNCRYIEMSENTAKARTDRKKVTI